MSHFSGLALLTANTVPLGLVPNGENTFGYTITDLLLPD